MRTPCLAAFFAFVSLSAPLSAQGTDSVWVNTRSGVYHCRGTEFYGSTTRGEYLSEAQAVARGHRSNGGRRCSAATPAQEFAGFPGESRAADLAPPTMPASLSVSCTVSRIIDGDTFDCAGVGTIRPIGMDAPERTQEPHGSAATAALASLLVVGDTVRLESDNTARDQYDRVLAYVWHNGEMVNWQMVRQGWAAALPFPATSRYAAKFEAAERAAERERRGLWHVDGFACRPQDHRARKC
ncbi:MAG: thermonuclease family protein [Gemmatimonadetes bacterium]|nr:thermonuclease family protein [Gemmatimonadota bacterium]